MSINMDTSRWSMRITALMPVIPARTLYLPHYPQERGPAETTCPW